MLGSKEKVREEPVEINGEISTERLTGGQRGMLVSKN